MCAASSAARVLDHGFTVISDGGKDPIADIVLVHGLGGNPRRTWSASIHPVPASAEPRLSKGTKLRALAGRQFKRLRTSPAAESKTFAPSTTIPATGYIIRDGADEDDALKPATADLSAQEAASSSSNIFWPKDLLAEDFKTIRILTFSYESDPRRPEQHNLYTLSNILLSRLADKRADFPTRPIIFICHSLGGILTKFALKTSQNASGAEQRLRTIRQSTHAVVFFATPHAGSHLASWGELLARISGVFTVTNTKLLATLNSQNDNGQLEELRREFDRMLGPPHKGGIKVVNFRETKPMMSRRVSPAACLVVPLASAEIVNQWAENRTLDADHREICKFGGRDDPKYEDLKAMLDLYLDEIIRKPTASIANNTEPAMSCREGRNATQAVRTLPVRGHHKRSIWKDGFSHGFQLERVPLIHSFVGRHEYMSAMEASLLPDQNLFHRKIFVLYGLGGIGKTQLAVEFARRHQTTFSSTFFIDGSSKDAVLQSFMRVFRRIVISDIQEATSHSETESVANSSPEKIAAKALEWFSLEGNHKWLLIFDNVDLEPSDPGGYVAESFFPASDCGSIIVTTRLASLAVHGTVKQLRELDTTQSVELLTGHITEEAPPKFKGNAKGKPDPQLVAKAKLVEDLGGLPLAISQAGKLMKSLRIDVEEYLELYKSSKRKIIDMLPPEVSPSDPARASIRTTWTTSVNILKSRMADEDETGPHRCACRLLHLFAYFEPTDYDYRILEKARLVNNVPAWCKQVFDSKLDFYSTVKILLDLSLLDKTSNNGSYSMHRVVYDWLCTYIAHETDDELLNLAAAAIGWSCPVDYTPFVWAEEQQRLILHANVLYPRLKDASYKVLPVWYDKLNDADHQRAAELFECDLKTLRMGRVYQPIGDVARLLSAGGRTQDALSLIEDLICHTVQSLTKQDELYFTLLYEKSSLLSDMSDFGRAETTLIQALDGFKRLQNDYWIVCTLIMQGCSLAQQGHTEPALEFFSMALETSRTAGIGVFLPPAWLAFNNIDRNLRWIVGDNERRKVHLETIKIGAEAVGYNSANAQSALRELASVYVDCGNTPEAERLFLKLLRWKQDLHGRDALETGWLYHDLGVFYFNLSRIESIEYDEEWLQICSLHHGSEGRETSTAHYWVAESYERHFQYATAQGHFEKALTISQKCSGLQVMEQLILDGLIRVCGAQRKFEKVTEYEEMRYTKMSMT